MKDHSRNKIFPGDPTPAGPVDLHTHSTASDGTCSPAELIALAAATGLAGLALTDYDTLAGLAEAAQAAAARGIRLLPGIELSARWRDATDVHLLGYRVDNPGNAPLAAACAHFRAARRERAQRIVANLNAHGIPLTVESDLAEAGSAPIGRPHIARALVAAGHATDLRDAFRKWLTPGQPGYAPREHLALAAAIQLLRASGAAPVLAHPQTLQLPPADLEALVKEMTAHGLAGIEAYWSQHTPESVAQCESLAARYDILATGGSDFHGANKPNRLGESAPGHPLTLGLLDALEQAADAP